MSIKLFSTRSEKQRAYRERKNLEIPDGMTNQKIGFEVEVELPPLETLGERLRRVRKLEVSEKLWGDLFVTCGINFLYADRGIGKTKLIMYLMTQWAKEPLIDLLTPSMVCGLKGPEKAHKILFCDYELTDNDYERRRKLLEETENIDICESPILAEILARANDYTIIVIDNISFLIENLNSSTEVKNVLSRLKTITKKCTLIILGHMPFEKQKIFGSKFFEIMASSLIRMYLYQNCYCFNQEKSRDFTIYSRTDVVVLNEKFEYQSVLNTKVLEWGDINILIKAFLQIKKDLDRYQNNYLLVAKEHHLKLKELEVILTLGAILYCRQNDYQFLMNEPLLIEPVAEEEPF